MITFSKLGKLGRLGNQLFQIASSIGIAKKYNHKCQLPPWVYSKYFNWEIKETSIEPMEQLKEPYFHYCDNLNIPAKGIVDLFGYFQSEKYFKDAEKEVRSVLSFNKKYSEKVYLKYSYALRRNPIAISIRRGDYVDNPNYELLPIEYYLTALFEHFSDWQNRDIVVFSDDIEYCRLHFSCYYNFYIVGGGFNNTDKRLYFKENESAIEQLCLMSMCSDFIISNSTFAWWGAWLSKNKNKVIRPAIYVKGNLATQINMNDHYPSEWISHDHRQKRISLKNVTFTIPVKYDHSDRRQNLNLNILLLLRMFDCSITVGENGGNHFEYLSSWCTYMNFEGSLFHRTKMLNEMAKASKTDIIVNHDADVFLPPLAIIKAVEFIKLGADMVYPYDGRFARVSRSNFITLQNRLDVGCLAYQQWPGTHKDDLKSVGGSIFFNKESFFRGGGENTKFISYGPEDTERMERFTKAGFKVKRIPGMIYHIDHHRGKDSLTRHEYFKKNEQEFELIKSLTKEELLTYIKKMEYATK
jgi:hypothetical protein